MKDIVKLEDSALSDYFYTILFNCSTQDRLKLPMKYQKMVFSERSAKKFASNSSIDEKMLVLSYLGIKHFLTLTDSGLVSNSLREILKKYVAQEDYKALKEVVDSGIYVTSNKRFVGLLSLVSNGVHSTAYRRLMEEKRIRYHAKKWSQSYYSSQTQAHHAENEKVDLLYMRTLAASNNVIKRSEFLFNMKECQMAVLLFMFPSEGKHVPAAKISDYLVGCYTKMDIATAFKALVDSLYLEMHPFANTKRYAITAAGINVVRKFQDAIDQLTNFGYD